MAAKFETGKSYFTTSACDHNCIIEVHVLSRTAKTLKTLKSGKEKTLRIGAYEDGIEFVKPWGSYSMAPFVSADRTERPKTDWEK